MKHVFEGYWHKAFFCQEIFPACDSSFYKKSMGYQTDEWRREYKTAFELSDGYVDNLYANDPETF